MPFLGKLEGLKGTQEMTLANPYLIEESQSKLLSNSFSQFLFTFLC